MKIILEILPIFQILQALNQGVKIDGIWRVKIVFVSKRSLGSLRI